jgi:hypothetical protein
MCIPRVVLRNISIGLDLHRVDFPPSRERCVRQAVGIRQSAQSEESAATMAGYYKAGQYR